MENHERLINMISAPKPKQPGSEKTSPEEGDGADCKNVVSQETQIAKTNDQKSDQPAPDKVVTEKNSRLDNGGGEDNGSSTAAQSGQVVLASAEALKRYFPQDTKRYFPEDKDLLGLLSIQELNVSVLEDIFTTGFHNVATLAMTSFKLLGRVRELIVSRARFLTVMTEADMWPENP